MLHITAPFVFVMQDTDTEEPLLTHSAENNNYGTKSIDHMENGEEDMYRTLSTQSHSELC